MSIIATTTDLLVVITEDVVTMDRTVGLVLTLKPISRGDDRAQTIASRRFDSRSPSPPYESRYTATSDYLFRRRSHSREPRSQKKPTESYSRRSRSLCTLENLIPTVVVLQRIRETPSASALTSQK